MYDRPNIEILTQRNGYVVVEEIHYPVDPGDAAYIPPDTLHSVVNESEGELEWAAFWWDVMAPQERSGSLDKEEKHDECAVFNDR